MTITGSCLCGSVTLTTEAFDSAVTACHCGMCRTWGGGPLFAARCGSNVEIAGEELITVFDSSPWAERGFCKKCGTHLFYRVKQTGAMHVPMGLIDRSAQGELATQLFTDLKPSYYTLADETEMLTEAQVYERYAPKD